MWIFLFFLLISGATFATSELKLKPVPGAKSYCVEFRSFNSATTRCSETPTLTISDLPSGTYDCIAWVQDDRGNRSAPTPPKSLRILQSDELFKDLSPANGLVLKSRSLTTRVLFRFPLEISIEKRGVEIGEKRYHFSESSQEIKLPHGRFTWVGFAENQGVNLVSAPRALTIIERTEFDYEFTPGIRSESWNVDLSRTDGKDQGSVTLFGPELELQNRGYRVNLQTLRSGASSQDSLILLRELRWEKVPRFFVGVGTNRTTIDLPKSTLENQLYFARLDWSPVSTELLGTTLKLGLIGDLSSSGGRRVGSAISLSKCGPQVLERELCFSGSAFFRKEKLEGTDISYEATVTGAAFLLSALL